MRAGIDPAGQARDDHQLPRQIRAELFGHPHAVRRGIAGADHADRAGRQQGDIPQHGEHRRRISGIGQKWRIVRVTEKAKAPAQSLQLRHFALRLGAARQPEGRGPAAGPGQIRKRRHGLFHTGKSGHQALIGEGADALGPDQPQPIDRVGGGRIRHVFCPILGSVPSRNRAILALCFQKTMAPRISASIAKA